MQIPVRLKEHSYPILIERGALQAVGTHFALDRKALVLTDDGVPPQYAEAVAAACQTPVLMTVPQGEGSKSFAVLERILDRMLEAGFSRRDCVVTVGGGVVSDLGGFAASVYMRGIDCYTVSTTVLSSVDASVGGKTAINFAGIKNVIGAFKQPKDVLIDPDTLKTLPARQVHNGLAEAVKMALTSDADLFSMFENGDPEKDIDEVIARAVMIKRDVVERDETEQNLRRILNFGHTIGHGIESAANGALYHGECVAVGMLPMCSEPVQARLLPVLKKLGLPTHAALDPKDVYAALTHDKKANADHVAVVRVDEIGSCRIETVPLASLRPLIESVVTR
ncbi:MAG: 3-dehydroquinate synthase [Clostridia bacterium]|nr:3-dehydroquinate synthase [Clostridia bacterium]